MGQKVNPIGYRLGVNKDWQSKWYAKKDYPEYLINDIKIREYLEKNMKDAAIASVIIERKKGRTDVTIYTAKPGVIIGRGGEDIEKLRKKIAKLVGEEIYINIVEEIGKEKDLVVSASVTVKPEVKLGEYKGLNLEEIVHTVSDDDVAAELKRRQERGARQVTVEDRPVQDKDEIILDFEGFVDGEAFEGGKGEGYPLKLGSGNFIPGIFLLLQCSIDRFRLSVAKNARARRKKTQHRGQKQ